MLDAKAKMIEHLEEIGYGKGATQYKLRDAIFGRQRYWGEPIPYMTKVYQNNPLDDLPLTLPEVDATYPRRRATTSACQKLELQ